MRSEIHSVMTDATRRPRILIVESQKTIARIISLMLSSKRYCCEIVATGDEAVDVALKTRPDLILTEIKLDGEIDGITVCEQIKAIADIPVIFISVCGEKEIVERANRCNPCGYIRVLKNPLIEQLSRLAGTKSGN